MQPITADPLHLPQLIGAMKHYLWTLKITHGGADLDGTLEMAKGALDPDLQCVIWNLRVLGSGSRTARWRWPRARWTPTCSEQSNCWAEGSRVQCMLWRL